MDKLTHFDKAGNARMVDISEKVVTTRVAMASGQITIQKETLELIKGKQIKKGDVYTVANVAAVMAVKKTPDLIPMCHQIAITGVEVNFSEPSDTAIECIVTVKSNDKTGVEMEALTGVTTALLTIFDMCKAVDKTMEIRNVTLLSKQGGKSGDWKRSEEI